MLIPWLFQVVTCVGVVQKCCFIFSMQINNCHHRPLEFRYLNTTRSTPDFGVDKHNLYD
jgi:hypothetical protein